MSLEQSVVSQALTPTEDMDTIVPYKCCCKIMIDQRNADDAVRLYIPNTEAVFMKAMQGNFFWKVFRSHLIFKTVQPSLENEGSRFSAILF